MLQVKFDAFLGKIMTTQQTHRFGCRQCENRHI